MPSGRALPPRRAPTDRKAETPANNAHDEEPKRNGAETLKLLASLAAPGPMAG